MASPAGSKRETLFRILADGAWHTGTALGGVLGCSRAAVWKQIVALREMGLEIHAQPGKGYRLGGPLEPLDPARIIDDLDPETRRSQAITIAFTTTSTSDLLLGRPAPERGRFHCLAAEFQSGGRGRRGRQWICPVGHGICFSLSWQYPVTPPALTALSLAVGLVVAEALQRLAIQGLALKWPNDVLVGGRKLAGVLIDVTGESGGPLKVVVGIGLNYRHSPALDLIAGEETGGLPPVSLDQVVPADRLPDRNALLAALLNRLHALLAGYADHGIAPLVGRWRAYDHLHGRALVVSSAAGRVSGVGCGITPDGALRVRTGQQVTAVVAGDVTLRHET